MQKDKNLSAEQPCEGSAANAQVTDKFQTPEQLRKAYEALEAEFTRKSQQLSQLRREHDQLLDLRGKEQEEKLRDAAVESFVCKHPKAAGLVARLKESIASCQGDLEQELNAAYIDILDGEYCPDGLFDDAEFLKRCAVDQRVKDRVISDYLEAISRNDAPRMVQGGYIPVRNRGKAVSLDEAAKMTKEIYK